MADGPAATEDVDAAPGGSGADTETAPVNGVTIDDVDRDSLSILPLAILPLTTRGLQKSRMIKNARLQTVIEIFSDDSAGSLQLEIDGVPTHFGWVDGKPRPDLRMLHKLKELHSFDVYSLRIQLRALGIEISDNENLKLSAAKTAELNKYMTEFTRPLIQSIYGKDDNVVQEYSELIGLFRSADAAQALEKLNRMAQKLDVHLEDLPPFLADCGDIFLSLSYYRQCFDQVVPIVGELFASIKEMRGSFQLKTDRALMDACDHVEAKLHWLTTTLSKLFGLFDHRLNDMWENLSAERFREIKDAIERHHTTVGGLLCALNVKMRAWKKTFPDPEAGGLIKRGEFLISEIKQGLDNISAIQEPAQSTIASP
ncbi:MAG TPA: hypothetical protein VM325_10185 [Alphaproteobacteria bacterium]|nr:hypothetical protein [Alphaproteobacteria bacterium]